MPDDRLARIRAVYAEYDAAWPKKDGPRPSQEHAGLARPCCVGDTVTVPHLGQLVRLTLRDQLMVDAFVDGRFDDLIFRYLAMIPNYE